MTAARLLALVLAASLLGASTAAAQAQPTIANERARAHFDLAVGYFETAEYEEALAEFQRAYELSRQADILYNIHLVHERMGNLERAIETLERYLAEATAIENRATLQTRLQSLRARVARQRPGTGAEPTPPPPSPGPRDGAGTPSRPRARPTARPSRPEAGRPEPRTGGGGAPIAPIVSFGVAGAGAITFGVFGALALAEDADVAESCGDDRSCEEDEVSTLRTLSLVADIGLGVAVVGAAVGVVLLLSAGDDDDSESPARGATHVRIAPVVGPRAAGATLDVRF